MPASTFVWISSEAKDACIKLGFAVYKGRGENRHYVSFSSNPFDPSSEIHRFPRALISEVTVRAVVPKKISLGGYHIEGGARMRVSAFMERQTLSQSFFTKEISVVSENVQQVDIRAPSLERVLHIYQQAAAGSIKPDPVYDAELMATFD